MRLNEAAGRWTACAIASFVMLLAGPAASALGAAKVRFVNAAPGPGTAELKVVGEQGETPIEAGAAFGDATGYVSVVAGPVRLVVAGGETAQPLAESRAQLDDGASYTVVAASSGDDGLRVYRDRPARARVARLRVIHAAGELGDADIRLGGRTLASSLELGRSARYRSVEPGTYTLSATRPGGNGGALVEERVTLTAGTAFTAVVAGSGGMRSRLVLTSDDTVIPKGAPATGLGGLARDEGIPWLLVALAALGAGVLGGLAYRLAIGPGRPRS